MSCTKLRKSCSVIEQSRLELLQNFSQSYKKSVKDEEIRIVDLRIQHEHEEKEKYLNSLKATPEELDKVMELTKQYIAYYIFENESLPDEVIINICPYLYRYWHEESLNDIYVIPKILSNLTFKIPSLNAQYYIGPGGTLSGYHITWEESIRRAKNAYKEHLENKNTQTKCEKNEVVKDEVIESTPLPWYTKIINNIKERFKNED